MSGLQHTATKWSRRTPTTRRSSPRPSTSRDPFWRNRRSFLVTALLAAVGGAILTASVAAAPAGETSRWSFEDGSGTTASSSQSSSLDGAFVGAPTWTAQGAIAGGIDFSGEGARVLVTDPAGELSVGADGQITISAWFKTTNPFVNGALPVIASKRENIGGHWILFRDAVSPTIEFAHLDDAGSTRIASTSAAALLDNDWHHVVGVVDGVNVRLFIDGQLASATTGTASTFSSAVDFSIGGSASGGPINDFEGVIDEVAVYPNALDSSEITDVFDDRVSPSNPVVNSTGSAPDLVPGDGRCDTGGANSAGETECTLRAAIAETNGGSANEIAFDIPVSDPGHNAGTWTITPSTPLPWITASTVIDARTQPGWTDAPLIVLDGSGGATGSGLTITGAGPQVSGLSIVNFVGHGIHVDSSSVNARLSNNYIGVMPNGTTDAGNTGNGIHIASSSGIDVGASTMLGTPGTNVISGNVGHGIFVVNSVDVYIVDNLIGVTADATGLLGNSGNGVHIAAGNSNTTIGEGGSGNTVGGNVGSGISLRGGFNTIVQQNFLGTDASTVRNLGNLGHGVSIADVTSDVSLDENNIAFNTGAGVDVEASTSGDVGFYNNFIWQNGGLGLDLNSDGPTLNDPGDGDSGPNDLLNYPVITAIRPNGWGYLIDYELDAPAGSYAVKFYTNPSGGDPSGFGEGESLLDVVTHTHPGGSASYSTPRLALTGGEIISPQLIMTSPSAQASEFGMHYSFLSSPGEPEVNSTDDDGDNNIGDGRCDTGQLNATGAPECTLRAAIAEANASVDESTISFDIPTADSGHNAGVWTIQPTSALPLITTFINIDGSTQPGTGSLPSIELDGSAVVGPVEAGLKLTVSSTNSTVAGLAIGGFASDGIDVAAHQATIQRNVIGLRADGTTPNANSQSGIAVSDNAMDTTIGGASSNDRNIISGNGTNGIVINGDATSSRIDGNYIGTDATGQLARPNQRGILLSGSDDAQIGSRLGNVISGNTSDGITFINNNVQPFVLSNIVGLAADGVTALGNGQDGITVSGTPTRAEIGASDGQNTIASNGRHGVNIAANGLVFVQYNDIGTNAAGDVLGNGGHGVYIDSNATSQIAVNTIANNADDGIGVTTATPTVNAFGNIIYNNGGLAFDLRDDGPTANDPGDGDGGTNGTLNFPIVTDVDGAGTVTFTVDAPANNYRADLFNNPSGADPSGFGEAEVDVATLSFSHPGGSASYTLSAPSVSVSGQLSMQLISTGTSAGSSSEYGPIYTVVPDPSIAVVNSTGDADDSDLGDGICWTGALNSAGAPECTLTAAIKQMNNLPGANSIHFAIPTSDPGYAAGVWTINPSTDPTNSFPDITGPTDIDATTQAGYVSAPVIRLDGTGLDAGTDGIRFNTGSDGSTLTGFSIVNMPDGGAWSIVDGVSVFGNYLGLNPDGTAAGNTDGFVVWSGATNTTIGGAGSARNVISGNTGAGVRVTNSTTQVTEIRNNLIGVAPNGVAARPNRTGLAITDEASNTVIVENTVSENTLFGIQLSHTMNAFVYSNSLAGNDGDQIRIEDFADGITIGGVGPANTIANGGRDGIVIENNSTAITITENVIHGHVHGVVVDDTNSQAAILNNSIYDNTDLGIDLGHDGATANDPSDIDAGPNSLLNTPVITQAIDSGGTTMVEVFVDTTATPGTYIIELFDNSVSGNGRAETRVHTENISYPGTATTYSIAIPSGSSILTSTLTNTSSGTATETSEVSAERLVTGENTITDPGPQSDRENDLISLPIIATQGGTDPLVYSAVGLPDGLSINPGTGEIGGRLSYDSAGTFAVDVSVTSTDGGTASASFVWTVANRNRVVSFSLPNRLNTEGDSFTLDASAVAGPDPDGDVLTWSAINLPPGLSIDTDGQISGTFTFASAGSYTTQINAFDGTNSSASAFTWTVQDTNRPPVLTDPGLWGDNEGVAVSRNVSATDPDGDTVTWSATGLPPGLTIDPASGAVTGQPPFTAAGSYPVIITADDQRSGGATSVSLNWIIYNVNRSPSLAVIPDQVLTVGDAVSIPLSASDPDSDPISLTATGLPQGLSIDSTNQRIVGIVSAPQTITSTVVAQDSAGAQSSAVSTWTVQAAPATTTTTTTLPPTTTVPPTTPAPTTTTTPTTTAPTTTAPTTTAPTTTTPPTTTAPKTTAPTTTAPATTTPPTTTAPTTTLPATAPPEAIPFVDVFAEPDRISVTEDVTAINVIANDVYGANPQILSVTQPLVGSVQLVNGGIEVTVPPSFAGEIVFSYTLTDDTGTVSTAEVAVFSVNVLSPAGDRVTAEDELTSVADVFGRATTLFTGLFSIRLTTVQLTVLGFGPVVFALLRLLFVRREDLLSVTSTARSRSVSAPVAGSSIFSLRHDAVVWSDGKKRTHNGVRQVRIELPNGAVSWLDEATVTDTGF